MQAWKSFKRDLLENRASRASRQVADNSSQLQRNASAGDCSGIDEVAARRNSAAAVSLTSGSSSQSIVTWRGVSSFLFCLMPWINL